MGNSRYKRDTQRLNAYISKIWILQRCHSPFIWGSPIEYINYLKEREYEYIISVKDQIDSPVALDAPYSKYNMKTILTDTGGTLNSVLLEKKLVDEISLIITPSIVGENSQYFFKSLRNNALNLKLDRVEALEKNYAFIRYDATY